MKPGHTIYIIGAGAIGKALAVCLAQEDRQVVLVRGSVDNQARQHELITVELNDGRTIQAEIEIGSLEAFGKLEGLVVLTIKTYGNETMAKKLRNRIGDSPMVILQNGLEVETPFLEAGFPSLFRCVLFAACQFTGPGSLQLRPAKPSVIGCISGDADALDGIVKLLHSSAFGFVATDDIQPVIWTKAIINIAFNSICPLLEADNGIFHRNAAALALARRVVETGVMVANRSGLALQPEEVMNTLVTISKSSDGQLISTYQDILNKRDTEIESLNGALVQIAGSIGLEAEVREIRLLGELVLLKSGVMKER